MSEIESLREELVEHILTAQPGSVIIIGRELFGSRNPSVIGAIAEQTQKGKTCQPSLPVQNPSPG